MLYNTTSLVSKVSIYNVNWTVFIPRLRDVALRIRSKILILSYMITKQTSLFPKFLLFFLSSPYIPDILAFFPPTDHSNLLSRGL